MAVERVTKELVLGTGLYAYTQDLTTGLIKVFTGPAVINQSAQERPVIYGPGADGKMTWVPVEALQDAVRNAPIAPEGSYLTLFNPTSQAADGPAKSIAETQPKDGMTGQRPPALDVGRRVNIPGPVMFSLWPGQVARYTRGHHLRLNQYLKVQVYNEQEAEKHWNSAVVQSTSGEDTKLDRPETLAVGTTLIVKGEDVSFYIPPTGIKVLEKEPDEQVDGDGSNTDPYVRDALTLERLEYAVLVDEDGKKRYEKGPNVVFPQPTEQFVQLESAGRITRKFRAHELTPIQGIHLKVIAAYKEGDREYKEGEEIFLTGKDVSIYYPREEHALIKYDGQAKHYATTIPAGEARYVLNRLTGEINTVKGPKMYLPDPRVEVFVRRGLSDQECELWYPGNAEVLAYNRQLREMLGRVPSTRAGAVSDGDYTRGAAAAARAAAKPGGAAPTLQAKAAVLNSNVSVNYAAAMESSTLGEQRHAMVADEISRGSTYTDPRTLTLNTKLQGVPTIRLWPGYAIMVSKQGSGRRAVVGPTTVHLDYDETLEKLTLSTGKPKTTDALFSTCYLKITANKVADIVEVETADHVQLKLKLSYKVNFEGAPEKWFNVENYVKYMTDRMRSILKGEVHKIGIAQFYANYTDIVRDIVLGTKDEAGKRAGEFFEENGMRVDEVDVLEVAISSAAVKTLLDDQQNRLIKSNIEIANAEAERAATERIEDLKRQISALKLESSKANFLNAEAELDAQQQLALAKLEAQQMQAVEQRKVTEEGETTANYTHTQALARKQKELDTEVRHAEAKLALVTKELEAKTAASEKLFASAKDGFSSALLQLGNQDTAIKIAEAVSVQRLIGGGTVVETFDKLVAGTPMEGIVRRVISALPAVIPGNGKHPSA